MKRRHLFDNGFPVSVPTLFAGSQLLLAISRAAVRTSRARLAVSYLGLADSAHRLIVSRGSYEYTRQLIDGPARTDQKVEADAAREPHAHALGEEPHSP